MVRRDAVLMATTVACLLFMVLLLANNILPTRQRRTDLKERREILQEDTHSLLLDLERLNSHGDALESDPYAIDREMRRTFNFVGPKEKVLRVAPAREAGDVR